ncbi:hypothetical protein LEP1GSC047_0119 [Leptospira inadai serovar Lyme str. 10]|uniref:Uncharacterized protein n=2 Tax=Leptospira inadai serovar Lyme TaxID=293084 RepID=V6I0I7_9LEPT|nr:hypothetical protein [Leptospira inadai]EQA38789.1 hypothetical protein LEP1GSC047_0119 [Leptospira inadai serovar Lyme str. 10]PNV74089.1 hypothetical protein BES34_015440 [Leptospira inadai serovar Lyme]
MEIARYSPEAWQNAVAGYAGEIRRIGHEKSPFWLVVRTFASAACEADDPESFYDDLDAGFTRELTEEDEYRFDEALSNVLDQSTEILVAISEAYNEEDEERAEAVTDEAISGILGGLKDAGIQTMADSDLIGVAIRILNTRLSLYEIPVDDSFSVDSLKAISEEEERNILEPFVSFLLEDYKSIEDQEERFALLMQILFDTLWALFYLGLEEDAEDQ